MQTWSGGSAVFQTKCQNGEEMCDFDRGMIVGARQGGLSISETADLLGFCCTTVSRVCREWCGKKKKHPVSSSSVGRNVLLMGEVRGEGPDLSKLTGR